MKPIPVHSHYLISIQRPKLWIISALGIALTFIFIVWLVFDYGQRGAGFNQARSDGQLSDLQGQIDELVKRNNTLHRQNAKLLLDHNIDKDAGGQVQKGLVKAQQQILEMREELTFYRSIVAPKKSKRAIAINKVNLNGIDENRYKYKVVLIQEGRHDRVVRGLVEIFIEGVQPGGEMVRLALSGISTIKGMKKQKFGFKYYQNFEGVIRIPDGFEPKSLFVKVSPKSSKIPRVEKLFTWDDVVTGGEQSDVGQIEN